MPQLWDHQQKMLNFSMQGSAEDFSLHYAEPSTGKTLFGLEYLRNFNGLNLVICPASSMQVWNADYQGFYSNPDFELHVLDKGTSKEKFSTIKELYRRRANAVIVLSYETAARIDLSEFAFHAAVSDEAHRLGQHNGAQSMKIAAMLKDVPYKVAMTGTPYHDGYEKVYGITRFLNCHVPKSKRSHPQSGLFGHYDNFLRDYCNTFQKGYVKIIVGYRNIDKLAARIKPFTMLTRTDDVHDLPPFTERVYRVALSPKVRRVYHDIATESATEVDGIEILAPHVLTRTVRLQQIASAGVLVGDDLNEVHFDMTPRLDVMTNILDDIGEEPCVIFTKYDREVDLIAERLREMGVEYGVLTGGRNDYLSWREGQGRVLIVNLKAGSESVRLERAAHTIFWSVGYSIKEFVQARARTRRVGQLKDTVHYHFLVAEDTIDEQLYEILHDKSLEVSELDQYLRD